MSRRSQHIARSNRGLRRGVILVDAIVGSILLAVALTVVLGLAARAMRAQAQGDRMLEVAALLDEQLNLVLMRGPDDYRRRFGARGRCEAPFEEYEYELELTGGTGGDPYLVRATVSWEGPLGTRSESIETYIAPRLGDDPDPERVPDQPVERYY